MSDKKLSLTFKAFRKMGIIHDAERYGNISLWGIMCHTYEMLKITICFRIAYKPGLAESLYFNKFRAYLWRKMGCHVGKNVCIGHSVSTDIGNVDLIYIEDNVIITNCCIILCHRRDMKGYRKYDSAHKLPYIHKPVVLKRDCQIGMGSIIMPGVTIGEGAIIGARSVVTKDIPAWTVATGCPCKVIREVKERGEDE